MEADQRELALAQRHILKQEQLARGSKQLPPLREGDKVAVQDAPKNGKPGKWNKTGSVVECLSYESYLIRMDASRHIARRNRVHLRHITPYISVQMDRDPTTILPTVTTIPAPSDHLQQPITVPQNLEKPPTVPRSSPVCQPSSEERSPTKDPGVTNPSRPRTAPTWSHMSSADFSRPTSTNSAATLNANPIAGSRGRGIDRSTDMDDLMDSPVHVCGKLPLLHASWKHGLT